MSNNKKLVPKRRFKGYNNEWKLLSRIGDYSEILTGGTPSTQEKSFWQPKEILWMSSGEVHRKRILYTDNMISKKGFENSSARWVKENSILIALAGQGKTRGTVAINHIPITTNQSIASITPSKILNSEFLFQNFDMRYEELRTISSGDGTRGGLNKKIISNMNIITPSLKEQTQIGEFFKKLDTLIQTQQKKLEKTKILKSAYLTEMFPCDGELKPKLRFKNFDKIWNITFLGLISQIKTGESDAQDSVAYGKYPFFVRSENIERSNRYLFDGEAILIPGEGRLGEIFHYINGKFDYHQRVYKISNFSNNIDGKFIFYLMQKDFKEHALKYTVKATVDSLRLPMLTNYRLKQPILQEQNKVSSFFVKLDQKIALEQRKLEKLNNIKQAYLNEMFV